MAITISSRYARLDERRAIGVEWRHNVPLSTHAEWKPPAGRPDPVDILIAQGRHRLPERYARMKADPLAFLCGAAAVMAADLASGPTTKLRCLCGRTLARAHARAGDATMLSAYMGVGGRI